MSQIGVRLVALGPGHVVFDTAAGSQVVLRERGGVGRRAPPALELARIGPQLPDAIRGGVELGVEGHGQGLRVLADGGDGHGSISFVSLMTSVMRSMRPRHNASYSIEQAPRVCEPCGIRRDDLAPAGAPLGHKAGSLEHRNVLLHGREAHGVVIRKLGDPLLASDRPANDVAPGGVREGGEDGDRRPGWICIDTTIWLYVADVKPALGRPELVPAPRA